MTRRRDNAKVLENRAMTVCFSNATGAEPTVIEVNECEDNEKEFLPLPLSLIKHYFNNGREGHILGA